MIYLVGGFMRSGTSMMMRCLEAGGMECVYSPSRDTQNKARWDDDQYAGNSGGFYELQANEYRDPALLDRCEGKVLKCLRRGPLRLPAGRDYRIVIMRRDSEEIRQSAQAIFRTDLPADYGTKANEMIDLLVVELRARRGWQVLEWQYRNVLRYPLARFKSIGGGWGLDPVKAAAEVRPALRRFRREELQAGV